MRPNSALRNADGHAERECEPEGRAYPAEDYACTRRAGVFPV